MTIKTTTALKAAMDADLPNNTSALISPADVRENMKDIVDNFPYQDITSSGTHSGALVIDLNHPVQNITLNGNITELTTTSRDASKQKSVKVLFAPGASTRTVAVTTAWNWLGIKPSSVLANLPGVLVLTNFGSAETDILAAYYQTGSGV